VASEHQKPTDDIATSVALAMGKDAARRAVDGLLSSDEERAREDGAKSKSRRNKLIVYGILALLVLVGVAGMMLRFWPWFLLLGLIGFVGLYGWSRIRKRFAGRTAPAADMLTEKAETKLRVQAPADAQDEVRDAQARAEANALAEREIEDELLAMKARLDK